MSYYEGAPVAPGGGGAVAVDWQQLTGLGAVNDAGSFTTTGTGEASDGTLSWVTVGDTTLYAGWQASWPGWTVDLLDLYPDWSDATDRLDLLVEIAALPLTTAKYGLFTGVIDAAYSGRATAGGVSVGLYPNSTTVVNGGQGGATTHSVAGAVASNTNPPRQFFGSFAWEPAGTNPRVWGTVRRQNDDLSLGLTGTAPTGFGAAANRRLFLGLLHLATVSGVVTVSARWYQRRIRTTDPFV